jgi:hypothetical protein
MCKDFFSLGRANVIRKELGWGLKKGTKTRRRKEGRERENASRIQDYYQQEGILFWPNDLIELTGMVGNLPSKSTEKEKPKAISSLQSNAMSV